MTKQRISIFIGLILAFVFMGLALQDTDLKEVGRVLKKAHVWLAIPLLTSLGLFYWIKAIRWRVLLSPLSQTTARVVFPSMMIGFAANNVLPARLGELVRIYILGKQLDLPKGFVLATLVLERIFDFLTVFCLVAIALVYGSTLLPELETAGYFIATLSFALIVMVAIYATFTGFTIKVFSATTGFLPTSLQQRLIKQLELGAMGFHSIKNLRFLIIICLTSIVQWVLLALCFYIAMLATHIDVPWPAAFVLLGLIVAGLTLPGAPGFFGTVELCFTLALTPYNVRNDDALATAIFYHGWAYLSVTLLGIFLIHRMGYSFTQVSNQINNTERN